MKSLNIEFENCYGIKKLQHSFDFTDGCVHVIYAPNGAMKSSFAKTFDDLSKGEFSKDRVFKKRTTVANIKCNETEDLDSKSIFVIERYKENFNSDKISTLLVNKYLQDRYKEILIAIDERKDSLTKLLQSKSGLKNELTAEFTKAFNMSEIDYFPCLELISHIVNDGLEQTLGHISYKEIFNDKVLSFLNTKNFQIKLDEYMSVYDQLVSNSTYFKKGVFNHNNADVVSKTLKSNGFFEANHSVSLNIGHSRKEVLSQEELELEINSEKSRILKDEDLVKKFKAIDDAITKNISLKDFRSYLGDNPIILPEIKNLPELKKKLWCAYFKSNIDSYNELLNLYREGKIEIEKIIEQAKKEETSWKNVVNIFNERFSVPYKILVKNQDDVILKGASPNISFEYFDGAEKEEISGAELIKIISTGEQRALYLLNIIFEIEIRKSDVDFTLLIIDDIADSFDYKNKYAIIEYLKDILESEKFKVIILTHNFDFYRTVLSRLSINSWKNCLISIKSDNEVKLVCGNDNLSVFNSLKKRYHENPYMLIACIPFVRNLIEYTAGTDSINYNTLTALLHIKSERTKDTITYKSSINILVKDLEDIFNDIFKTSKVLDNRNKSVLELIMALSENLSKEKEEKMNLENKLVLSIAIRLQAEAFMINKINNKNLTDAISKHQTARLLKIYKEKFSTDLTTIKALEQVNLMTSENIHINSFMYEPLLDLSDHHLKSLYNKIKGLII